MMRNTLLFRRTRIRPFLGSSRCLSTKEGSDAAAAELKSQIRRQVLTRMAGSVVVISLPVAVWWYSARQERAQVLDDVLNKSATALLAASSQSEPWLEQCQAGDVIVFDRRCHRCAAGPWAALACLAGRQFLCNDADGNRTVDAGKFDHIGLIVPGHVKGQKKKDYNDPERLLLLEATPSGIVARPLQERLECSASRSAILLQLCSPGEKRNDDRYEPSPAVERTQDYVEQELVKFRDTWLNLGQTKHYGRMHSTLSLGGAVAYGLGIQDYMSGPVSPSAYLVLMGLQRAAAAQNINEKQNQQCKVEDFLRDYRFDDSQNAVRLRPGWRFLAPIPLRETSSS